MSDLKLCPFHAANTCACNAIVNIPNETWNNRPIEDALQSRISELEHQIAVLLVPHQRYEGKRGNWVTSRCEKG